MIEACHVSKTYTRGRDSVCALENLSFRIENEESVALLGRSGSGKSTLMNLLAGLDRVSQGDLAVHDTSLSDCTRKDLDRYRREAVGVVFQQFRLIKHFTAAQNVEMPLMIAGQSRRERRRRVEECLDWVGLTDRKSHQPAELSGGEQQRIAVARAIANRPRVLLADEPTGNLDSSNARQIMDLMSEVRERAKATMILITHDEILANNYSSRVLRLSDGRLTDDSLTGSAATDPSSLAVPRKPKGGDA